MKLAAPYVFVFFDTFCTTYGRALSWPTTPNVHAGLPILNVHLAPPRFPHVQVESEVARLDKLQEDLEAHEFEYLESALESTLAIAKDEFRKTIWRVMHMFQQPMVLMRKKPLSLLQMDTEMGTFAAKISVFRSPPPPSEKTLTKMRDLEDKRQKYERSVFAQATHEFRSLTDIVNQELHARLFEAIQTYVVAAKKEVFAMPVSAPSFLTTGTYGLSEQANVRLAPSPEKWPMVSELIQDMEDQRDNSESEVRSKILAMELRLLQAENHIIEKYLRTAVRDLMAA